MSTRPEHLQPEVDELKIRYMASPHVEWTKFAEAEGIPINSRNSFPFLTWRDEKRKIIAQREAEELTTMLFDRRFKWHKDVLKTLKEYPESCDILHQLVRAKMQEYVKILNDDVKEKPVWSEPDEKGKKTKLRRTYDEVSPNDLQILSMAVKNITDAKHRSLLLNDWNVKLTEAETQRDSEKDVTETGGISIEVIGMGELKPKDIEDMMRKYIDQAKDS